MHGDMQKRPKEQRQEEPKTLTFAGLAAHGKPRDVRLLGVDAAGLCVARVRWLERGLARGLVLGGVCLLIGVFVVESTRHGRAAERRAMSLARRDPSTIPASAPLKPSSTAALVYPPSMVNTAGPLPRWIVRSEASKRR